MLNINSGLKDRSFLLIEILIQYAVHTILQMSLSTHRLTKKNILITILICISSWIIASFLATGLTIFLLTQKKFFVAQKTSRLALPFAQSLSGVTYSKNATIETWEGGLEFLSQATVLFKKIEQTSESNQLSIKDVAILYKDVEKPLIKLAKNAPNSPLLQKFLDSEFLLFLQTLEPQLPVIGSYLESISIGEHKWLFIFQNSEELRANGGFLGSYALVTISNGIVSDFVIEDVYDTDGQFTGFIEAPAGVNEYLSGSNGLRLPDSNWSADYPSSAKTILQFFALGNKSSIDGVVAINLETVQEIVKTVEPLWLPDYQTHVTGSNLSTILREERGVFFPGNTDKKQVLSHVWSQLKIALMNANYDIHTQIARVVFDQLHRKHIQIYSTNVDVEKIIASLGFAGELTYTPHFFTNTQPVCAVSMQYSTCPTDYFYIVESNVGVNKANRAVTRSALINLSEYRSSITLTFTNTNKPKTAEEISAQKTPGADHNAYINYQRIIVPFDYTLQSVATDAIAVETIHENLITSSSGEKFKEIGFLITIAEEQSKTVVIELTHPLKSFDPRIITIQKQPGVPSYPVKIQAENKIKNIVLEKDQIIRL